MNRSTVAKYMQIHDHHVLGNVTFLDLLEMAADDIADPAHITERAANLALIAAQKANDQAGAAFTGNVNSGVPLDLNSLAGSDLDKFAAVVAAKLSGKASPAGLYVRGQPFPLGAARSFGAANTPEAQAAIDATEKADPTTPAARYHDALRRYAIEDRTVARDSISGYATDFELVSAPQYVQDAYQAYAATLSGTDLPAPRSVSRTTAAIAQAEGEPVAAAPVGATSAYA